MTDALPSGVITFNSALPAAPPQPHARSATRPQVRIVPPPPPHHLTMDRPSSRNSLSPLPRDVSPRESRARHLAPASDIHPENLSQSEARERLSNWVVYHFEKAKDLDGIDSNGHPIPPSWDHVRRSRIGGLPKREISKEVRDLDRKTSPVAAKKASLSEAIQNQLEMAQDHLAQTEQDPRYQYVLSQIDCQLKQRDPSADSEERLSRDRDRDGHRSPSSRRKSKSRKSKSKTRKTFERVSVTAYFKRSPRREEDAVAMYQRRERDPVVPLAADVHSRRASVADPTMLHSPSSPHHPHLTFADQHHHQQQQQRRHSQTLPNPVSASYRPSPPSTNSAQVNSRDGKETTAARDSPKTSQSSFTDDDFAISDNELTPQSSVDGSPFRRHNRQTRFRSRSRSRDRPRPPPRSSSTSPVPDSPRRHSRDDDNHVWASVQSKSHAPPSPGAKQPRTSPIDIRPLDELDRFCKPGRVHVRRASESWERGRRHEDGYRKDEGDEAVRQQDRARRRRSEIDADIEVLEHSSKSKQHHQHLHHLHHTPPPLSQPSRVNRRRASVRIIAPGDVGQDQGDRDVERHFERLRLDEERHSRRGDKVRFQDAKGDSRDHERRSRRSVDYTARHPDEIFHMEDDLSWDERAPKEYKRRPSSSEIDRNPFTGRPLARRITQYR